MQRACESRCNPPANKETCIQRLLAIAAVAFALMVGTAEAATRTPEWIRQAFLCIHSHEAGSAWTGRWKANTGNGYYGGLQMDWSFMRSYGSEYLRRWGTANNWPPEVQIFVAYRAWKSRGFGPWPNTRHKCGV